MRLLLLFIPLLCVKTYAVEDMTEFTVIPSECIATEKGDTCQLPLMITYPELTSTTYCLLMGEEPLGCWPAEQLPQTVTIELSQDSMLILKEANSQHSRSVNLRLKYRKASMYRRRVRNPWSLF